MRKFIVEFLVKHIFRIFFIKKNFKRYMWYHYGYTKVKTYGADKSIYETKDMEPNSIVKCGKKYKKLDKFFGAENPNDEDCYLNIPLDIHRLSRNNIKIKIKMSVEVDHEQLDGDIIFHVYVKKNKLAKFKLLTN